jgi:hypothetical protein
LTFFTPKIKETLKKRKECTKIKLMWQITQKTVCVLVLLLGSFTAVFAANSKNITLNIQGTGQPAFVEGFKYALIIEAKAAGYDVTDNMNAAKYSIRFSVEFDPIQQKSKFVVSLVKVVDLSVIVSMEYLFADEEEMLLYSQLVFFMLVNNIPENETAGSEPLDNSWRDKWLYISPRYNYSMMFMGLKPDGLVGGAGVYNGTLASPSSVAPIDNKIVPMHGIGLGLEFQFLKFLSIEPGAQISMEEVVANHLMYNLLLYVELKIPLKFFRNVVIAPYGIAAYPMRFPSVPEDSVESIFAYYPEYFFGGGIQIAVKVGKSGALFFDVNYLYLGDVDLVNQYVPLYSNPATIKYDTFALGFSVGYKIGLISRKK